MRLADLLDSMETMETMGDLSGQVSAVCYDSRQCIEDSLFVAVPGLKVDGHHYIGEAVKRGARFVVYDREVSLPEAVTAVRVRNSREALGILGRRYYGDPSSQLCLIGVTGTNGKTTVTYLLESIFRAAGYGAGVLGTVNYRYGDVTLPAPNTTPESFDMQRILKTMADAGVSHVAAEVSSHAIDLRRVDDCDFDLGIFTNLSQDHLDYHGTMENYYEAKKRFFRALLPKSKKNRKVRMVVNQDDPWGVRLLQEVALPAWGFGAKTACHVRATHYDFSLQGIRAEVQVGEEHILIESPLIGSFNLYNILAAMGAALALDMSSEDVRRGIAGLKSIPGRLERVSQRGQPHIFVDYAHTDDALRKVLENLLPFRQGRMITVFGCGGDRDRGKRPLMAAAVAAGSDWVILTSDNPRSENPLDILQEIENGIPRDSLRKSTAEDLSSGRFEKAYTIIPDRRSAMETAIELARPEDIVLIAGKGHEDYQIIGDRKIWFDDRVVAREALARFHGGGGRA